MAISLPKRWEMFHSILYYIKVVSTHHVSNQFLQYISIKIGLMPEVNGSKANSGASYPEEKMHLENTATCSPTLKVTLKARGALC